MIVVASVVEGLPVYRVATREYAWALKERAEDVFKTSFYIRHEKEKKEAPAKELPSPCDEGTV